MANDVGRQNGLTLWPERVREFMLPGTRALIRQAHDRGLKVLHHSCRSVRDVIGDLVDSGADAVHPIHALVAGMTA
jgi:uroporphyrinogen decarboxylase